MQNRFPSAHRVAWRRPVTWTIGIVVALAAIVFIHLAGRVDDSRAKRAVERRPEPIQQSRLLDAAVERIESEHVGHGPAIVSGRNGGNTEPRHAPTSVPVPPDGYSLVTFAGEMPLRSDNEIESSTDPAPRHPDWLDSTESVSVLAHQAALAGREWTFGWLPLAPGESPSEVARTLAPLGAEVLGTAGRLLRTRLPGDTESLRKIAATAGVDGLGATPAALKVPPRFAQESLAVPEERQPVFITLMADDTDGEWRHELERLGAVVGRYDDAIRVYTATADHPTLTRLVAADLVLAVEPVGIVTAAHDTAAPAMGVDALRLFAGSPGEFLGVGGASVAIGVMDTGLNIRHADIATNRDSICGRNFVWLGSSLEDEDLWVDSHGHGTHVTATIAGNGFAQAGFAGMAPSVRHIRFAKVLSRIGSGTTDSILQGMDFLAETSSCEGSAEVMPLVVNMSLSRSSNLFEGRGTRARKLDATVWGTRQLYVVAQSNEGSSGFSPTTRAPRTLSPWGRRSTAERSLRSASHGPTADGRLAPLVVATGVDVWSAKGDGSPAGYKRLGGTSMASPTVAGVAALLMDADPGYQLQPALVRSRLMASAIRPDAWLEDPAAFPLNNTNGPGVLQSKYGLGKVSARIGILDRDEANGWFGGGATAEVSRGEYAYHDIEVPDGATRLDIVMTWDEPPADTVVPPVLNNLDLWVDQGADCDGGPCGEYASTSRIDNVEWVIVRDPAPGTYRAKVVANSIYTSPPRAAVAWTVIRGPSTPSLQLAAESRPVAARNGKHALEMAVTVTADGYMAAGGRLHLACRGEPADCRELTLEEVFVPREDGLAFGMGDADGPVALDSKIPLGEIAVGETQEIKLRLGYSGETTIRLYLGVSSWNANGASTSVAVQPANGVGEHSEVSVPGNDDLAAAEMITGKEGSTTIDLVRATPEPGEPLYQGQCLSNDCYSGYWYDELPLVCELERDLRWFERPLGSVWFSWTAPDTGLTAFRIATQTGISPSVSVRVFEGNGIAALDLLAVNHWEEPVVISPEPCVVEARRLFTDEVAFQAEEGKTYRIQVAAEAATGPLSLQWFQGRPANDDFANAGTLAGSKAKPRAATLAPPWSRASRSAI